MAISIRERRAQGALQRWLRRTALASIPMIGLCGCGDSCEITHQSQDGQTDGGVVWAAGSQHPAADCGPYCRPGYHDPCFDTVLTGCLAKNATGALTCQYEMTRCVPQPCGRLPAGLLAAAPVAPSVAGAELASRAHLEGAAVFAFDALERELIAHGAPPLLVERARKAQRDERRHHRAMSALAARYGARPAPVAVETPPVRTLVEMAVENAAEGCVRETYGAMEAVVQGETAGDRAIGKVMRAIAADEADHADLGWAIDVWARTRLSRAERARLDDACGTMTPQSYSPELTALLGLPPPEVAACLMKAIA